MGGGEKGRREEGQEGRREISGTTGQSFWAAMWQLWRDSLECRVMLLHPSRRGTEAS
jgi:hypothetical protein